MRFLEQAEAGEAKPTELRATAEEVCLQMAVELRAILARIKTEQERRTGRRVVPARESVPPPAPSAPPLPPKPKPQPRPRWALAEEELHTIYKASQAAPARSDSAAVSKGDAPAKPPRSPGRRASKSSDGVAPARSKERKPAVPAESPEPGATASGERSRARRAPKPRRQAG